MGKRLTTKEIKERAIIKSWNRLRVIHNCLHGLIVENYSKNYLASELLEELDHINVIPIKKYKEILVEIFKYIEL